MTAHGLCGFQGAHTSSTALLSVYCRYVSNRLRYNFSVMRYVHHIISISPLIYSCLYLIAQSFVFGPISMFLPGLPGGILAKAVFSFSCT